MKIELFEHYPALVSQKETLEKARELLIDTYSRGGKLLLCGNGGSAADCDHIAGELLKGFASKRELTADLRAAMGEELAGRLQMGLPAISLPSQGAVISAFCNDVDPELIYAQPLMGMGKPRDILVCISTSGNSKNVVAAAHVGKALGLQVIALTGQNGGKLKNLADICICVPETETFKVQELHLPVYHFLCASAEKHFFG